MIADKNAGVVRTGIVDDEDVADFRTDAGNCRRRTIFATVERLLPTERPIPA